jgi:hypothetical protein
VVPPRFMATRVILDVACITAIVVLVA